MATLNDTMARIAILRSEILSMTHSLDARAIDAPLSESEELTEAATALMQAAISLQEAENRTRRSMRAEARHRVLT